MKSLDLKIKICGITSASNLAIIYEEKCTFWGIIKVKSSKRYVEDSQKLIQEIKNLDLLDKNNPNSKDTNGNIVNALERLVYVFANEDILDIKLEIISNNIKYLQLHGDESNYYLKKIKKEFPQIVIIKAFRIYDEFDFELLNQYTEADFFLFDTFKLEAFGGTGERFNLDLLQKYQGNKPYFLSGGLSEENVEEVLRYASQDSRVIGLDFNSKLEVEIGVKNPNKVSKLFEKILGQI